MKQNSTISVEALRTLLEENKPVFVLDIRPKEQREEWFIPGSTHVDAYAGLKEGDASLLDQAVIPKDTLVVTVCALRKTAQIAADVLEKKGIDAHALEGGMKSWTMAWNTATIQFDQFEIIQIRRTGKGCLSYIIASGNEAIIVDPSLPADVYDRLLLQRNLTPKFITETHIHADHLSRAKLLAEKYHIPLCLPAQKKAGFGFSPVEDGDVFQTGSVEIKAIHTPGHTMESTCYLVDKKVLLTGDTLFLDGVGRPDLKDGETEMHEKSHLLYVSVKKLFDLPDGTIVLPGHTSKPVYFDNKLLLSTLKTIRETVALVNMEEADFVRTITSRVPPAPANYLAIVEANLRGELRNINPEDIEAGANRCAIS